MARSQGIKTQVQCESQFFVRLVPAEIDSILLNLVSNAVKAVRESENRSNGRIRLLIGKKSSTLFFRVQDNGCGVKETVSDLIFHPLEGTFGEGTGMGLPIVQYLATRYKGTVTHTSLNGPYVTEFEVSLTRVIVN